MRRWYPLVLVVAMFAVSIIAYPRLPERVPTHWSIRGEVNAHGPKAIGLFLMPVVMLGIWGLMRGLPKIDPRRENYAKMQGAYTVVVNAALTVIALVHVATIAATFGAPMSLSRVMPAIIGVMLVVVGNVLPQMRPNWFFGIRTPWTLSSDRVWERTHRVGGHLFVAAGIIGIASAAMPIPLGVTLLGIAAAIAGLGSVVYSYIAWRQEKSK